MDLAWGDLDPNWGADGPHEVVSLGIDAHAGAEPRQCAPQRFDQWMSRIRVVDWYSQGGPTVVPRRRDHNSISFGRPDHGGPS